MATKKIRAKPGARKKSGAGGGGTTAARKKSAAGAAPSVVDERVAEIQRVIDVMVAAGAVEVEMEGQGTRLRVRLKEEPAVPLLPMAAPVVPAGVGAGIDQQGAAAAAEDNRLVFKSPMLGTFYRASSPEVDPFVEVGDHVTADSTLCILEAMKVMNEIKAEVEGAVVDILAQDGEPVEFGQPLFVIEVG